MADVKPSDILTRIGNSALAGTKRGGLIVLPGPGRSRSELPETFTRTDATTCAPKWDRDNALRTAAANKLRIEPVDTDGDFVRDAHGLVLDKANANLVTNSDDLSTWTSNGTPVVTANFAALGDLSLTLIEDDTAAADEYKFQALTFTGDAVKSGLMTFRAPATPSEGNSSEFQMRDTSLNAGRLVLRMTWNSDGTLATPSAPGALTTGTLLGIRRVGEVSSLPVYTLYVQTTGVTAANNHAVYARPIQGAIGNAGVGKICVGGVMFQNALYPAMHRIKTTGSPGVATAADSLSVPFNWGPTDMTVLARVYRPLWADASGSIGSNDLRILEIGTSAAKLELSCLAASRTFQGNIDTAGTDRTATAAIPAGTDLYFLAQFKNLTTGGQVAVDVGSGLTAFSSTATAFSAFGSQTMRIGSFPGGEFSGNIIDVLVLRGLFSRTEAMAAL